jgi:hypothetical protein
MAKASTTHNTASENIDYTEEDMSETEEYFQNASPKNSKQSSSNRLEPQNNNRSKDDGVTIGVLPMEKGESDEEFENILLEAIDETLSSLGEPVKNAVYFHLQTNFNINKSEIPERIDEFSDVIHKIFGSGAGRLEIKFMKTLNLKMNVNIQWPENDLPLSKWIVIDMSFVEYVYSMRRTYIANGKNTVMPDQKTVEIF